jgi:hypothetical protein
MLDAPLALLGLVCWSPAVCLLLTVTVISSWCRSASSPLARTMNLPSSCKRHHSSNNMLAVKS